MHLHSRPEARLLVRQQNGEDAHHVSGESASVLCPQQRGDALLRGTLPPGGAAPRSTIRPDSGRRRMGWAMFQFQLVVCVRVCYILCVCAWVRVGACGCVSM